MVEAKFEAVGPLDALAEGEPHPVTVAGRPVVLVRRGERIDALSGFCPHTGMRLADGIVDEDRLVCFYHGANFELTSGKNLPFSRRGRRFDTSDVAHFAVRVENDIVYVATTPDD